MTDVLDPQRTALHGGDVDASPPPVADRAPTRPAAGQALQVLGLLLAWTLLHLLVLSGFQHAHTQDRLYGELRPRLAAGEGPTSAVVAPGTPLGVLSVPDGGLRDEVYVEGSRNEQLLGGPGHVAGSVLPGQQGVSVLAGRSTTYGAPFRDIASLRRGAPITVTGGQGTFTYRVEGVRTAGDPVPSPPGEKQGRLTLVSSAPSGGVLGRLRPSAMVYVDAVLDDALPASGRAAADPGTTHMTGRWDVPTLAQLVLALQLLAIALGGLLWAWRRWSRRAAWVAGAPVVLAAAWLVSSVASRLLPGLV